MLCCTIRSPRLPSFRFHPRLPTFKFHRVSRPSTRIFKTRRSVKWIKKLKRALRTLSCCSADALSTMGSDSDATMISTAQAKGISTMTTTFVSETTMVSRAPSSSDAISIKSRGPRHILSAEVIASLIPLPSRRSVQETIPESESEEPSRPVSPTESIPAERKSLSLDAYIRPLSPRPRRNNRAMSPTSDMDDD